MAAGAAEQAPGEGGGECGGVRQQAGGAEEAAVLVRVEQQQPEIEELVVDELRRQLRDDRRDGDRDAGDDDRIRPPRRRPFCPHETHEPRR